MSVCVNDDEARKAVTSKKEIIWKSKISARATGTVKTRYHVSDKRQLTEETRGVFSQ